MNEPGTSARDSWAVERIREERRAIGGLIILFWIGFQIIFFFTNVALNRVHDAPVSLLATGVAKYIANPQEIAIVAMGAAICFCTYLMLRRVHRLSFWGRMLTAGASALLSAMLFSLTVSIFTDLFGTDWPALTLRFFVMDVLRWLPAFGLWAGVALTVTYGFEMRDRERQLATVWAQAQEAQMIALRYQVNPHFLYNALNAIAALILDKQNDLAEVMVMRLSDFFRAGLAIEPHMDVPLIEETNIQRLYLGIEQMRFGERLTFDLQVAPDTEQLPVPGFILQPIIENALKHGVHNDGRTTHVTLLAQRSTDQLLIEISDNGPGQSSIAGTGIGLRNVRERLQSRYGARASLVTCGHERGFRARVKIPV